MGFRWTSRRRCDGVSSTLVFSTSSRRRSSPLSKILCTAIHVVDPCCQSDSYAVDDLDLRIPMDVHASRGNSRLCAGQTFLSRVVPQDWQNTAGHRRFQWHHPLERYLCSWVGGEVQWINQYPKLNARWNQPEPSSVCRVTITWGEYCA